MTSIPREADSRLFDLLNLKFVAHHLFEGSSYPGRGGRLFGGQILGQAAVAASATVPTERVLHSVHAYFLAVGDSRRPVLYRVESLRDGGSFSSRRITATQEDEVIFTMEASFQAEASGVEHQPSLVAEYPDPETLPRELPAAGVSMSHRSIFDIRRIPNARRDADTRQAVWLRAPAPLLRSPSNGTAGLHRAALAFGSDFTLMELPVRHHGLTFDEPRLRVASLDHSMWWHADAPVDDWLLYVQENPWAGSGRALVFGSIYDRERRLIATVVQEGMVRLKPLADDRP
ncbi:acyl-CoA thioesterase II [Frondihabitans sucicola]|uniref:Acyl-CoA thioesterase II n=1 Tax=Frondihabitans sucicola TaxID=1268041 RepID=A0ABN6XUR6_9MICO|nr:acyl-CoA thioesterase domain-containing protein [Frondihabitans sucicola]BDZ47853.1 acyl-CoA thioesterase II [Frondihabitans sucicola]